MRAKRITSLIDPRFLFRPDIFVRACARKLRQRPDHVIVKTPWGDAFEVDPRKFIGAHVYMRGVHELPVCEALLRLTDWGETAADIGANIGVMTSLLSCRVGAQGKVIAFEAHPVIVQKLRNNVKRWMRNNVQVVEAAVSKTDGVVTMEESEGCETNEGIAQVRTASSMPFSSGRCFEVQAIELDHEFKGIDLQVVKIDVEGHELAVLEGASRLLNEGAIRDIVFESTRHYPSSAHSLLLSNGYSVFRLESNLRGPRLIDPYQASKVAWPLADFIATKDPDRALKRFATWGWRTLYAHAWIAE